MMRVHKEGFEKIDDMLLQRTLSPYASKGAIYLQAAHTDFKLSDTIGFTFNEDKNYVVKGQFSISESCYIDETGHFNAVEFNICYNQLTYIALAHASSKHLLSCLQDLTLNDFYRKQLSNVYITRLESFYKRVINSENFIGVWRLKIAKKTQKMIILKTEIEFSDDGDGLAYGEVDLVIN